MKKLWNLIKKNIFIIFIGILLACRFTGVLTLNVVVGSSMVPTYHNYDYAIGSNIPAKSENLNYGDVVIAKHNDYDVIKRIIGMPGDHVQIEGDVVMINNEIIREPYIKPEPDYQNLSIDLVLGDGEYFICGDNRNNSMDSRSYGPITKDMIKSKVLIVLETSKLFPNQN